MSKVVIPSSTCRKSLCHEGPGVHKRQSSHTFDAMTRAGWHPM
ncbi:hypothetical protein MtrunA17_Chr1g0190681 [Medicago truncatula]|uniref:Uncharacterized protein n=1 Tax=Medicago truncatula TaxID=3880 RepID=A0A396JQW9_MEDTR|nr:hypothetical protein MtrunA17_Chr1g0190681 [Medicago truncatula]